MSQTNLIFRFIAVVQELFPKELIQIMLSYYRMEAFTFDPAKCHRSLVLTDNNQTCHTMDKDSWKMVYSKHPIGSCDDMVSFRVNWKCDKFVKSLFTIGICDDTSELVCPINPTKIYPKRFAFCLCLFFQESCNWRLTNTTSHISVCNDGECLSFFSNL